jgi:hypothetical protein
MQLTPPSIQASISTANALVRQADELLTVELHTWLKQYEI